MSLACRLQSFDVMSLSTPSSSAFVAVLAAVLSAACSDPPITPFQDLDTNGDGRISREEAARDVVLASLFTTADMDENGELTPYEYLQAADQR